jgi:hypothetical protein
MTSTTLPLESKPPPLQFVLCVEAGGIESMSIRAAMSLRKFGGRFASCPVMAVTPRFGAPLSRKTLAAFESVDVEYVSVRPPNPYPWYSLMNKPLAVLEAKRRTHLPQVCYLDSDMIVIGQPDLLLLDDDTDMVGCAADKNLGTSGDDDVNTPYWKEICQALGLSHTDLPWVHAHRENVDIRIYFNGGLICFRRSTPYAERYQQIVTRLLQAKISSQFSNIYFHEQAAVGLAAVMEKLRWKALPHEYNYAIGKKIIGMYEPAKVQRGIILHYHDMMWPENWPMLLKHLKADRPDVHDWLEGQGPLRLEGSFAQKAVSKLLKGYRKKKFDRHVAACNVV